MNAGVRRCTFTQEHAPPGRTRGPRRGPVAACERDNGGGDDDADADDDNDTSLGGDSVTTRGEPGPERAQPESARFGARRSATRDLVDPYVRFNVRREENKKRRGNERDTIFLYRAGARLRLSRPRLAFSSSASERRREAGGATERDVFTYRG